MRLLKRRKVSQRYIAAATGTSQKWISLVEAGEASNPSYTRLSRVRDFLVELNKQSRKSSGDRRAAA